MGQDGREGMIWDVLYTTKPRRRKKREKKRGSEWDREQEEEDEEKALLSFCSTFIHLPTLN